MDQWCSIVGINNSSVIKQISEGRSGFRHSHILAAAKEFNININWIYGLSETMILNEDESDPVAVIQSQLSKISDIINRGKTAKPKLAAGHKTGHKTAKKVTKSKGTKK